MEPFYYFFGFLRALFNFEARAWIPVILAGILLYILYRRKEEKKYEMTVSYFDWKETDSAKHFWKHYNTFKHIDLPKVYLRLVHLDYKKFPTLNLEFQFRLIDIFKEKDYLGNLAKIRDIGFKQLSYTSLCMQLESEKACKVREFVTGLISNLTTSFGERLALWAPANSLKDEKKYFLSFEKLKSFSDQWKQLESEDNCKDAPDMNFISWLKQYHADLYKNIDLVHEYVSPENIKKRYEDCLKKLLDFSDTGSVPKHVEDFNQNVLYFCGNDYANNQELGAEARKSVSGIILRILSNQFPESGPSVVKNIKELFDILGEYVVQADLNSLLICMSARPPAPQGFEG